MTTENDLEDRFETASANFVTNAGVARNPL